MPRREPSFFTNEIYHIFNRGVEKRKVFLTGRDYSHFLETLAYYLNPITKLSRRPKKGKGNLQNPDGRLVDVLCYCLMPNHFHLLLRQRAELGISTYMRRALNSFARYFNTKNDRVGPLFQGAFKAVRVESDEQLLHVSRYIHLNPLVDGLIERLEDNLWSSYREYVGYQSHSALPLDVEFVLSHFSSKETYKNFVLDQVDYAKTLADIKHHDLG